MLFDLLARAPEVGDVPQNRHDARAMARVFGDGAEQLEQQIDELKYNKAVMPADQYKKQLTALLLELAKTQEELEK